jgi:hypothetical protein
MRNQNHIYHRVLIVPSAVLAGLMLEWCYQRRIHVEVQTPEGQSQPAVLAFASDDRRRAALEVVRARLAELRLHCVKTRLPPRATTCGFKGAERAINAAQSERPRSSAGNCRRIGYRSLSAGPLPLQCRGNTACRKRFCDVDLGS